MTELKEIKTELSFLTVRDIQEILKMGRRQAYELANSNCFPVVRFNTKILIPQKEFEQWLVKQYGKTIYI